jgi:Zn-dependent peptidase ImmA (M78 family)/DNA-binding XRE family transcriptional regulator
MDQEIGARVRQYRLDRGLRQEDLAAVLDVDTSALSKIETGARKVSGRELIRLSKALNVGVRDILGTRRREPALQMAYRLTQDETQTRTSRSALVEALEVHALLEQVEAEPVHLAHPRRVGVERQLDGEISGRRAAEAVREALGLGLAPLQRVEHLIEQLVNGATVLGRPVGEGSMSGMCVVTEGLSLVFVNTSKPGTRQRFTLAHELAHLLFEDASDGTLEDTDEVMRNASSAIEARANTFAAELLAPTAAIRQVLERVRGDVTAALATTVFEYGVSRQAAAIALKRAGVSDTAAIELSAATPRYQLAQQYNYVDADEALRDLCDRTIVPTLLHRRAVQAWLDRRIGAGPIAALDGRDTDDVREDLLALQARNEAGVSDGR